MTPRLRISLLHTFRRAAVRLSLRCLPVAAFYAHRRVHGWRVAQVHRTRLVRRHPDLPSFFLVHPAATRHAPLARTIGDVVTVLSHLRPALPALPSSEGGRDAGSNALRILVVDPQLPMYDKAAGSLRLFRILGLLREAGHQVTFLARNGAGEGHYRAELEAMGIVVHAGDPERCRERGLGADGPPLDLVGLLRRGRFDIAWLDFYELAEQYLPVIRAHSPSTRILVDTVDVHWLRQHRQAEIEEDTRRHRQARATRLREKTIYRAADGLIAVTPDDERALRQLAPKVPTYVLGTVHPLEQPGPDVDSRSGVVFVGNFNHPPNVDAALHLVRDVMPLVWEKRPAMQLIIVGTNPPPAVRRLAGERVTVTGHVPHTRPYLDAARVSVAPLRFGAGMKGKVGEALAAGLPVATTPIGAEGMGLEHGVHALIADTATGLAASIIRLHTDTDLWSRLSEAGRREVESRYGAEAARSRLVDLLGQVTSRTAFVWVPDWDDVGGIDDVLGSYAEAFRPTDPVALVVGVDTTRRRSRDLAVAALTGSLARLGRDPGSIAKIAVTPFPIRHADALLCPGAIWVTGQDRFPMVMAARHGTIPALVPAAR